MNITRPVEFSVFPTTLLLLTLFRLALNISSSRLILIRGNTGTRGVTGVLPYREARDEEDERHVHPLQLDVIERACVLWSNLGENVLTPFMGVGSEVCGAVMNQRRGIGIELKPSYYRQAVKNLTDAAAKDWLADSEQVDLFDPEEV